jgi:hypothetical protein
MKTSLVDGFLFVRLAQWDTEERPDVNPVPKLTGISYEREQVREEVVGEVLLDFLLQVSVP